MNENRFLRFGKHCTNSYLQQEDCTRAHLYLLFHQRIKIWKKRRLLFLLLGCFVDGNLSVQSLDTRILSRRLVLQSILVRL